MAAVMRESDKFCGVMVSLVGWSWGQAKELMYGRKYRSNNDGQGLGL